MTTPRPIVVFASMYFDGHQLYDQRISRALAAASPVLFVEPPTSVIRRRRHAGRRIGYRSAVADGVDAFTPAMLPLGGRPGIQHLTALMVAAQVWFCIVRRLHTTRIDAVYIAIRPTAKLFFPSKRSVSLVKDDYAAGAALTGLPASVVLRNFRASMRRARSVAVVSPSLKRTLLTRGLRAEIIPAGCEVADVALPEPDDLAAVPHPRILFVGMVSDRLDLDLLTALAGEDRALVMVGETQPTFTKTEQWKSVRSSPRCHVLAPRTGRDLDAVIQHCDVGVIPYELTEFNRSSFPLKAFEYLACGLPVVSTALPSMVWLDFEHLHTARTATEFVELVDESVIASADPEVTAACQDFASRNTWAARAERFRALLERP